MRNLIPTPQRGQPLRADWARAVTDAANATIAAAAPGTLVRDGAGALGNVPIGANARDRREPTKNSYTFELKWAPELNDGSGGWIIYEPSLIYNGRDYDYFQGFSYEYVHSRPLGWHPLTVGLSTTKDDVLSLIIDKSSQTPSVYLACNDNHPTDLSDKIEIPIAVVLNRRLINSDVHYRLIQQMAVGVIIYSDGGESGDNTGGMEGEETVDVVENVCWDSSSHQIQMTGETLTFTNGLLTGRKDKVFTPINTTPYSQT